MAEINDRDYYVARATVSRELARRAPNATVAAIHDEFAARYEGAARLLEDNPHLIVDDLRLSVVASAG